jgi:hypothetical protein
MSYTMKETSLPMMCHRVSLGPSSLVSLVSGKSVPVLTLVVLNFKVFYKNLILPVLIVTFFL